MAVFSTLKLSQAVIQTVHGRAIVNQRTVIFYMKLLMQFGIIILVGSLLYLLRLAFENNSLEAVVILLQQIHTPGLCMLTTTALVM